MLDEAAQLAEDMVRELDEQEILKLLLGCVDDATNTQEQQSFENAARLFALGDNPEQQ